MEATIETRIQKLERQVAELTEKVTGVNHPTGKDWRATIGMLPKDDISEEADRLGREWREGQSEP
jgi:hypothetical protein